jgi:hypothetical protein
VLTAVSAGIDVAIVVPASRHRRNVERGVVSLVPSRPVIVRSIVFAD